MVILIIIFISLVILGVVLMQNEESKKKEKAIERGKSFSEILNSFEGFTPTSVVYGPRNIFAFAVDDDRKEICYLFGSTTLCMNYSDIMSAEIIDASTTISRRSTIGMLAGAALGGMVAGDRGAVLGSLASNTYVNRAHSYLSVKITVRNTSCSSFEIPCFSCKAMTMDGKPAEPNNANMPIFLEGLEAARSIVDMVNVILDYCDRCNAGIIQEQSNASVADELEKLANLKDKGILTEAEFAEQKKKLLKSGPASGTVTNKKQIQAKAPRKSIDYDPFDDYILSMVANGQALSAVKEIVAKKGLSITEAKEYLDNLRGM